MLVYEFADFQPVPHVNKMVFYCPGCNASYDDYDIPAVTCPCAQFAEGAGSLTITQAAQYLAKYAPIPMPHVA